MKATQEKQIGEFKVTATQLMASKSFKAFARLGRMGLPAFSKAVGVANGTASIADLDVGELVVALGNIFERLTDAEIDWLLDTFLKSAFIDDAPFLQVYELKLQGRLEILLQAIAFAIQVNYANFFGAVSGLVGSVSQKKTALTLKSISPETSATKSGPSGDSFSQDTASRK